MNCSISHTNLSKSLFICLFLAMVRCPHFSSNRKNKFEHVNPFHSKKHKSPKDEEKKFSFPNFNSSFPKISIPSYKKPTLLEISFLIIFKKQNKKYVNAYQKIRPNNVGDIASDMFATYYIKAYLFQKKSIFFNHLDIYEGLVYAFSKGAGFVYEMIMLYKFFRLLALTIFFKS